MRNAAVVLLSMSLLCACSGPIGPIPGGKLQGTPTPWPDDWNFSDEVENILLETNPDDPYSVTVWCVTQANNLYVAAASEESRWVQNMRNNPKVLVNIDGQLFTGIARDVSNNEEIRQVIQAYLSKYEIESEEDFVQEGGVLFRVEHP